jgi:glycopeptide antibiotics resistance protein
MSGTVSRRLLYLLGAVYLAGVAAMTLRPQFDTRYGWLDALISWFDRHGVPVTYGLVEALANVAMFVPYGVLAGLLLRRWWWCALLAGAATSAAIELAQLLFLPSRVPSLQDVAMNTLGTALGLLLLAAWRWIARRDSVAGRA